MMNFGIIATEMTRNRLSNRISGSIRLALAILSAVRLLPHIAVFVLSPKRELQWKDLDRYGEFYDKRKPQNMPERLILFVRMMTFFCEYRNVFYHRHRSLRHFLALLCRPMRSLSINTNTCGPGLFIRHGFGTLLSADEIGANCSVSQLVTVGYVNNSVDRPRIGNNVTIAAGARVLGAVTIGDNAFVSANSLVISDVPPGATVIGVPARIVNSNK